VCVDHRGDGVGGIVKAIHELEPERHEQRQAEEKVRHPARGPLLGEIADQVHADKDHPADEQLAKDQRAELAPAARHRQIERDRGSVCHVSLTFPKRGSAR